MAIWKLLLIRWGKINIWSVETCADARLHSRCRLRVYNTDFSVLPTQVSAGGRVMGFPVSVSRLWFETKHQWQQQKNPAWKLTLGAFVVTLNIMTISASLKPYPCRHDRRQRLRLRSKTLTLHSKVFTGRENPQGWSTKQIFSPGFN